VVRHVDYRLNAEKHGGYCRASDPDHKKSGAAGWCIDAPFLLLLCWKLSVIVIAEYFQGAANA